MDRVGEISQWLPRNSAVGSLEYSQSKVYVGVTYRLFAQQECSTLPPSSSAVDEPLTFWLVLDT